MIYNVDAPSQASRTWGRGAQVQPTIVSVCAESEPMENNKKLDNRIVSRLKKTLPEHWEKAVFHRENENSEWSASYFFKETESGRTIEVPLPLDEEFQINLGRLLIISRPPCDVVFFSNGKYQLSASKTDIKPLSICEIQVKIDELRKTDLKTADIDDLIHSLNICFRGYKKEIPIIRKGMKLYRGVKWDDKPQKLCKLTYPPKDGINKYHRAGRPGQPIFYCSSSWQAPFYEKGVKSGDRLALSTWITTAPLIVNHAGYDAEVLKDLGSSRDSTSLGNADDQEEYSQVNIVLDRFLSKEFARNVPEGQEYLYKLSIAIAESHFKSDKFDGLLYPALAMRGNADNLALKPRFVDRHMKPQKVEYVHVDEVADNLQYKVRVLDFANSFTKDGHIEWKGRHPQWVVRQGESLRVSVENERWVARNTQGDIVEPE